MVFHRKIICRMIAVLLTVLITAGVYLSFAHYLTLKNKLVSALSRRATLIAGQQVSVRDLTFSLTGKLTLYDIGIKNPEGFGHGDLIRIKMVGMDMNMRELFRGKFVINDIILDSPALTFIRDKQGRTNISDTLMKFFSKKSDNKYSVDRVRIYSGIVDLNGDGRFRNEDIELVLNNISSERTAKTMIQGSTSYAGNMIKVKGWAYLNDAGKKFAVSLSSRAFSLQAFSDILKRYNIDSEKLRMQIDCDLSGDTKGGIALASAVRIKEPGLAFFTGGGADIQISADALYNIAQDSLVIRSARLQMDALSEVEIKGEIADIQKTPSYSAGIRISRLDLSRFHFFRDAALKGTLNSDALQVKGRLGMSLPSISGSLSLENGSVKTSMADVGRMGASLKFSPGKGLVFEAEAEGEIRQAGTYVFRRPAGVKLSLYSRDAPEGMSVKSGISVSELEADFTGDRIFSADILKLSFLGTIRDMHVSGRDEIEINNARYAGNVLPWLKGSSLIDMRKDFVEMLSLRIETKAGKATADRLGIRTGGDPGEITVALSGVNVQYPERSAEVGGLDVSLRVRGDKVRSADLAFTASRAAFEGIEAGAVSGSGRVLGDDFFVDAFQASFFGGILRLSGAGKTGGGYLPLKFRGYAENIDMGIFSRAVSKFVPAPYLVSGSLMTASLEGTMHSSDSLDGKAFLKAEGISVLGTATKKDLLKGGSLSAEISFKDRDLEFTSQAGAGSLSAGISGSVKDFLLTDRSMKIHAVLPRVQASEVRNSLWDVFPDSLLYAGLDGSISSDISLLFDRKGLVVEGGLTLRDFVLTGENQEYSIGPVSGLIPLSYSQTAAPKDAVKMPSFERAEFDGLKKYYRESGEKETKETITIGSLKYGFRLLEDISIRTEKHGGILNIPRFSATISGGKIHGSAFVDIGNGFRYRAGIIVEGMSLARLCNEIEPIKGYLSGRIDGIMDIRGSGTGISGITGRADFWSYSTADEKTRISREFLQKIGGPSLKTYIGDRGFSRGVMSFLLKDGFIIFRELEISNRNIFGIQDLSMKVAPFNNRISIDHLMWTITEAAQRAKKE